MDFYGVHRGFDSHYLSPINYLIQRELLACKGGDERRFKGLPSVDRKGIRVKGYFVSTVGINEATIRKYVERLGKEDTGQAELAL